MNPLSSIISTLLFLFFLLPCSLLLADETLQGCFQDQLGSSSQEIVHTPNTDFYSSLFQLSIRNLRFASSSTSGPLLIVAPTNETHIQASIICCKKHGTQVRVRSGGHDFEGLSYTSADPFVLIDLSRLNSVSIDIEDGTPWAQAGATLGEVYYSIAEESSTLGFPAGYCHTVGVGGHLSGGGVGNMMRKYGLAADNILDAKMIDVNVRILDRIAMGEYPFWALRGGGGSSFGVIIFSWKIKLVPVPNTVTICNIAKNREEGATDLVYKWQNIASQIHENIYLAVTIQAANATDDQMTIRASFRALALWGANETLPVIHNHFPELGLEPKHCTEMGWIQSRLLYAGLPVGSPTKVLLDRSSPSGKGFLYNIQYLSGWQDSGEVKRKMRWVRKLYKYMTPYVSKFPRGQYINTKDLDLGKNDPVKPSYTEARVWGEKYFGANFRRLALVKDKIDPENFFRNEQIKHPTSSTGSVWYCC
ncbi:hypothetical protein H6P81_019107 [Aristolochia fimbriata]|uniref:FAD-binding PCMH-type domain-containing protein n=1 Tax=Aristolochia fimbriata TaxID=158543 RepID=A0AAV7DUG8_ARIFI|nr:hypothetical protein H6P81_019107 [Aristolochia fimbriata]